MTPQVPMQGKRLILALTIVALLGMLAIYVTGYLGLGTAYSTQNYDGSYNVSRVYPHSWQALIFQPAAKIESWATGAPREAVPEIPW